MSNELSIKRMFRAISERINADEPWHDVLDDYGLMMVTDLVVGSPAHSVAEQPGKDQHDAP